jgi:uncharacterized protein (TIGR02001 family)
MTRLKWLIAAGLVVMTGAAQAAGLSSTWTITTDYDFRGITQTAHDAALQGSVDYAWATGFSVGAWVSNINFDNCCDEKVELDLYGGYSKSFDNGFGFTVNGVYYTYPGSSYGPGLPNLSYWEANVGGSYKNFNIKYWYSGNFGHVEDLYRAVDPSLDAKAWYLEANYSFALPKDITLALHAGTSRGHYWDNIGVIGEGPSAKYEDYSVGFSKTFGDFTVTAKYVYPQVDDVYKLHEGAFSNNPRALLSVATTFQ